MEGAEAGGWAGVPEARRAGGHQLHTLSCPGLALSKAGACGHSGAPGISDGRGVPAAGLGGGALTLSLTDPRSSQEPWGQQRPPAPAHPASTPKASHAL